MSHYLLTLAGETAALALIMAVIDLAVALMRGK